MLHAPASGYRTYSTGALGNIGTGGYAWSSSPIESGDRNASFLGFSAGYMHPLRTDYRAYAFTVRCVQHLQAAFY